MRPRGKRRLRDVIGRKALGRLALTVKHLYPRFDRDTFLRHSAKGMAQSSFFQRIERAARALNGGLTRNLDQDIAIMVAAAPPPLECEGYGAANHFVLILCRYVSLYAIDRPALGLPALGRLTRS